MSLYRQAGRVSTRTVGIIAAAALVTGGGVGYAIGSGGGDERTSVADAVTALRADVRPIRNALEFLPTEYSEGVEDGRVVSEAEYGAANAAVRRALETLREHEADLGSLSRRRALALRGRLEELAAAVGERRDERDVQRLSERAKSALQAAVG